MQVSASTFSFSRKEVKEKVEEILKKTNYVNISTQDQPQAFILGGLPGSGKTFYIQHLAEKNNAYVINGDNYRKFHPRFQEIVNKYSNNWVSKTADFTEAVIKKLLEKGIQERKNIIVEGTFRTFTTPANTLRQFKEAGYRTNVHLVLCHPYVARTSTISRFREMQKVDPSGVGRSVSNESFQETAKNFAQNADKIRASGLTDYFVMVARRELNQYIQVYNERSLVKPSEIIEYEKTRKLSTKEEHVINSIIKAEMTEVKSKNRELEK